MPEKKDELLNASTKTDSNYWRSFEDLYKSAGSIEAKHHEFKDGVTEDFDPKKLSNFSRRKFLALLGASAALAGTGCNNYPDRGEIIPYNKKPEEITLGVANYYASTASCEHSCGVLIKTREGRPIKIDGNPDHPVSKGKMCTQAQASILDLYNPERIKKPLKLSSSGIRGEISWGNVDKEIIQLLNNSSGKQVAVITKKIVSPTEKKLLDEFAQKYNAKIYSYELFNEDVRNRAWKKSYGSGLYPKIKWNEARVIVALESDFLGKEGNRVENARLFAEGRDVDDIKNFNRLYVVEGNMSLTGINADYRLRLRPDAQHEFTSALLEAVNGSLSSLNSFAKTYDLNTGKLKALVNDLKQNRGKAIVYAGSTLPEAVHLTVNAINNALSADALFNPQTEIEHHPLATADEFNSLVKSMNSGMVAAVIHYDSNPVYHLSQDIGYKTALKKVPAVISLTGTNNETAAVSSYTLPINHTLEVWGDVQTRTGFISLQQPVIAPLFSTRQKEAILLTWLNGDAKGFKDTLYHEYLMNNWQNSLFSSTPNFNKFWVNALHDGVVVTNETSTASFAFNVLPVPTVRPIVANSYVVALKSSYSIVDGSYADNGWLQELPHPVSKITWDNYAAISHITAKELGVENDDIIDIQIGNSKLSIPVFLQPGSSEKTITIELGYGRENAGAVGTGVGFNANVLMNSNGLSPWLYNASVVKGNGSYQLVTAQEHHVFDDEMTKDAAQKRGIIQEGTVEKYKQNPHFMKKEEHEKITMYGSQTNMEYPGLKWGMAIDLNKCLGCSDCVVACISENNIPVVGKDQVAKGREMHWLRIDRYYSGTEDEPKTSVQPMLCQHCDHAPCENVCPVVATTHSTDGLNQMIYNRCVGTRYCSNNCPYKVRRFNFFNYRDYFRDGYQEADVHNLIYNPEVTVRSRGVMEKCTFCIQRIMEARENATAQNRTVRGSDVKTACQEACPTTAIKFGDVNEKESEFAKFRNHELGYYVLEELNVRPNVTYITKLRNTHSEEA
ncbi:MAG: TAT-variant-translocated molybdopterin oxidoreductase [Ignavibacteriaceae bacterium]|nr:TAT-variant-translocated molybdopterin oxidoreductase [Ignavibacteriaceae bacterium]